MSTLKLLSVTLALAFVCVTAQAQFGKRFGGAVQNAAENATIRKAEQKTDEAVSKGIDKATDPDTYKGDGKDENRQQEQQANQSSYESGTNTAPQQQQPPQPAAQTPQQSATMAWNRFDFVSGDEIIFEDNQVGERLGEFPSQWDLIAGNSEIAKIDGENVIYLDESTTIAPLMKNPKSYLPESYTVEFDFFVSPDIEGWWRMEFRDNQDSRTSNIELWSAPEPKRTIEGSWTTTGGEQRNSSSVADLSRAGWHRVSVSFNQRALKVYFDEVRVMNVPNVAQAGWVNIFATQKHYIKNFRMAQGAVPLYDRMMSDGKFITYGITFDTGKSAIKPESMGEITRIVTLMKENPTLKFSVEGHTDSAGNAAANQTLSEARSQAVVDKLAENGIARDRLKAAGKGQTSPISDNGTDEGRAKNRRVEFVKL
jgi:outer membrane protein OmpA-like peptidoglycan-associated protein